MISVLSINLLIILQAFAGWLNDGTFQIAIQNANTKAPVPYVNVLFKQNGVRLTTNQEGKFHVQFNSSFAQDTLAFSSIGYKTLLVPVRELVTDAKKSKIIYLHEEVALLKEIMVSPLTARQIVQQAIEHIPENHVHHKYQINGFYRKAIKENNTFAMLIESVVTISETGKAGQPYRVLPIQSRISKDFRAYKQPVERKLMSSALALDHIHYKRGFLNIHNLNDWEFKLTGSAKLQDKDLYIIRASLFNNKKVAVHQATLFIRPEDYAFQKIDYDYTWDASELGDDSSEADTLDYRKYHWKGSFNYAPYKEKMVLSHFHFVLKQNVYAKYYIDGALGRKKKMKMLATQEIHEEFIENEMNKPTTLSAGPPGNSLPYQPSFWKTYNRPVDTALFLEVQKDLEKHRPFETLFQ